MSVEKVEGFGFVGFVFLKLPSWPSLAHFSQQFSHFFPVSSFSRLSFPGMGNGDAAGTPPIALQGWEEAAAFHVHVASAPFQADRQQERGKLRSFFNVDVS